MGTAEYTKIKTPFETNLNTPELTVLETPFATKSIETTKEIPYLSPVYTPLTAPSHESNLIDTKIEITNTDSSEPSSPIISEKSNRTYVENGENAKSTKGKSSILIIVIVSLILALIIITAIILYVICRKKEETAETESSMTDEMEETVISTQVNTNEEFATYDCYIRKR